MGYEEEDALKEGHYYQRYRNSRYKAEDFAIVQSPEGFVPLYTHNVFEDPSFDEDMAEGFLLHSGQQVYVWGKSGMTRYGELFYKVTYEDELGYSHTGYIEAQYVHLNPSYLKETNFLHDENIVSLDELAFFLAYSLGNLPIQNDAGLLYQKNINGDWKILPDLLTRMDFKDFSSIGEFLEAPILQSVLTNNQREELFEIYQEITITKSNPNGRNLLKDLWDVTKEARAYGLKKIVEDSTEDTITAFQRLAAFDSYAEVGKGDKKREYLINIGTEPEYALGTRPRLYLVDDQNFQKIENTKKNQYPKVLEWMARDPDGKVVTIGLTKKQTSAISLDKLGSYLIMAYVQRSAHVNDVELLSQYIRVINRDELAHKYIKANPETTDSYDLLARKRANKTKANDKVKSYKKKLKNPDRHVEYRKSKHQSTSLTKDYNHQAKYMNSFKKDSIISLNAIHIPDNVGVPQQLNLFIAEDKTRGGVPGIMYYTLYDFTSGATIVRYFGIATPENNISLKLINLYEEKRRTEADLKGIKNDVRTYGYSQDRTKQYLEHYKRLNKINKKLRNHTELIDVRREAIQDAFDSFSSYNEYPDGYIYIRNKIGLQPIETPGGATRWGRTAGYVGMGVAVLSIAVSSVALPPLALAGLAAVGAGAGLTSSFTSLAVNFQREEVDYAQASLDVIGVAAALMQLQTFNKLPKKPWRTKLPNGTANQLNTFTESGVKLEYWINLGLDSTQGIITSYQIIKEIDEIYKLGLEGEALQNKLASILMKNVSIGLLAVSRIASYGGYKDDLAAAKSKYQEAILNKNIKQITNSIDDSNSKITASELEVEMERYILELHKNDTKIHKENAYNAYKAHTKGQNLANTENKLVYDLPEFIAELSVKKSPSILKLFEQNPRQIQLMYNSILKKHGLLKTSLFNKIQDVDSKVTAKLSFDFIDSWQQNALFRSIMTSRPDYMNSWIVLKKAGLDELATDANYLSIINKMLQRNGSNEYLINLLKTKSTSLGNLDSVKNNPIKIWLQRQHDRLNYDGKFKDENIEKKYTNYANRAYAEKKANPNQKGVILDRISWQYFSENKLKPTIESLVKEMSVENKILKYQPDEFVTRAKAIFKEHALGFELKQLYIAHLTETEQLIPSIVNQLANPHLYGDKLKNILSSPANQHILTTILDNPATIQSWEFLYATGFVKLASQPESLKSVSNILKRNPSKAHRAHLVKLISAEEFDVNTGKFTNPSFEENYKTSSKDHAIDGTSISRVQWHYFNYITRVEMTIAAMPRTPEGVHIYNPSKFVQEVTDSKKFPNAAYEANSQWQELYIQHLRNTQQLMPSLATHLKNSELVAELKMAFEKNQQLYRHILNQPTDLTGWEFLHQAGFKTLSSEIQAIENASDILKVQTRDVHNHHLLELIGSGEIDLNTRSFKDGLTEKKYHTSRIDYKLEGKDITRAQWHHYNYVERVHISIESMPKSAKDVHIYDATAFLKQVTNKEQFPLGVSETNARWREIYIEHLITTGKLKESLKARINKAHLEPDFDTAWPKLQAVFETNPEYIDTWHIFADAGLHQLGEQVEFLKDFSRILKQDGFDDHYFVSLLKSRVDQDNIPPDLMKAWMDEWLRPHINKINEAGQFADADLEVGYQKYIDKQKIFNQTLKDRVAWQDYVARNIAFDKQVALSGKYEFKNVLLSNGKRIDALEVKGKKISATIHREAINFEEFSNNHKGFRKMLERINSEFPNRSTKVLNDPTIARTKTTIQSNNILEGKRLRGTRYLEVPKSNESSILRQEFEQIAKASGFKIRYAEEFTSKYTKLKE
ncbi:MAG: hypothetical protein ACPGJS_06325 [Flammeovirgaceae bacterium]